MFEICFSCAYLVSTVVTYILIPVHIRDGNPTTLFFKPIAWLSHNMNVVFIGIEMCLNRLHFNYYHFIFAILFGLSYTLFSWYYYTKVGVFYYFFLDYDRKDSSMMYIAVMSVVSITILRYTMCVSVALYVYYVYVNLYHIIL